MARPQSVPGEKPLFWVGSAKNDLMEFPEAVKDEIGTALSVAQFGGKHPKAKPWKGEGPGVVEIVADHRGDTYRVVYTVKFEHAVYVLHAFQKKSLQGRKNPQSDVDLTSRRLRMASEDYEARYRKRSK
jgi:phage-related protein